MYVCRLYVLYVLYACAYLQVLDVCTFVCMCVCMYDVCIYVCLYVCMYLCALSRNIEYSDLKVNVCMYTESNQSKQVRD